MSNDLVVCADVQENLIVRMDKDLLAGLLMDRSTGKNIIWATSDYADLGEGYQENDEITIEAITGANGEIIKPRSVKSKEEQAQRVRNMAEVFTPLWICNKQNNLVDDEWFGTKNVFNEEHETSWTPSIGKVQFPDYEQHSPKGWESYIGSKRLEITCGEAPYLVSRYDTVTGELIPVSKRVGILDRKFRVINERVRNFKNHERTKHRWLYLALKAVRSTYGFEWSGDNLLLARENVLYTVIEYYRDKFDEEIEVGNLFPFVEVISWNIWQMDGIKCVVPNSCHEYVKEHKAFTPNIFDTKAFSEKTLKRSLSFCDVNEDEIMKCQGCLKDDVFLHNGVYCKIKNWSTGKIMFFKDLMNGLGSDDNVGNKKDFKFDVAIGNPPYQKSVENNNRQSPVYNYFMDGTFEVSDISLLITPARFLFDAGQTPKSWNKKMLEDKHFKVLYFEKNATNIFSNTDIKGGVVITYHDKRKTFDPVKIFTPFNELNSILKKVVSTCSVFLDTIISSRGCYRLSDDFFLDFPDAVSRVGSGTANMIVSNIFDKIPEAFLEELPNDEEYYYLIIGRSNNRRTQRYLKEKYLMPNDFVNTYNVLLTESNNNGDFGETLTNTIIAECGCGATDTFINIGQYFSKIEAENTAKYLKTKFARAMLGVLKATQHNPKSVWKYVPLQDFTSSSDIDWSKSVAEIDQQLYKKYGLSAEEIAFIEKNVKEMV